MTIRLGLFLVVLLWSGLQPKDELTWILETAPAILALVILITTRQCFRLTGLTYNLILLHCIILMIGGHYTYAEVPLFDWIKELLALERNNYDKVGHFAQGFVPAIIVREILIRNHVINNRSWLNFLIVCICLAISAFYELIEWAVALLTVGGAEAFLGTQGYIWDTQSDMAYALLGAILALALLSRSHDQAISKLMAERAPL